MSDPEQRRRRKPSPPPRSSAGGTGGGPLPLAALMIGVIVAGLGIGALINAFQNRATAPDLGPASIPAVTPVPQPTGPSPVITLAPVPSPTPTPLPSASASASPSPTPVPSHAPSPTPAPSATAAATPAPVPSAAPAAPAPPAAATLKPAAVVVPSPPAPPRPGDAATALVRRYIGDLIAGDEAGAYTALGGSSSDRTLDLKEEAFLDKDARITSMRVSRTDAAGETVDAEITSGKGSYVATFHVNNGPNGSIINQHDYIKI